MKTLVLGSTGLLGQAVADETRRRGWPLFDAARSGAAFPADISDAAALADLLEKTKPELVVNCAAVVDVKRCEEDPCLAWRVNGRPLAFLAAWANRTGGRLLQVSTDHYWTSDGDRLHAEGEPVELVNEYARSKFAGEALALTASSALVLRTSIVGIRGWEQPTFAEWAIETVEKNADATLFADAWTSSIDVRSFARAALDLALLPLYGRVNLAARQVYSKEAFVREIARQMGCPLDNVTVGSVGGMAPARAASLGLDVRLAERHLGRELPVLEDVVAAVIEQSKERVSA